MLSLRELERAAAILRREIVGHRIQQVVQTDATSVALELFGGAASFAQRAEGGRRPSGQGDARRRWLVLSCDPERARVGELREAPGARGPAPRFAQCEREGSESELRRRVAGALRKEAKSLDRKLEKVAREIASAETAASLERQGELLKSAQGRVKRGEREVVVHDWDSGAEVRIELDPSLGPGENLERIFARYRKGVRALTAAGAQQASAAAAREAVAALEAELAVLADGP